jgi:hypothetical protein
VKNKFSCERKSVRPFQIDFLMENYFINLRWFVHILQWKDIRPHPLMRCKDIRPHPMMWCKDNNRNICFRFNLFSRPLSSDQLRLISVSLFLKMFLTFRKSKKKKYLNNAAVNRSSKKVTSVYYVYIQWNKVFSYE